MLLQSGPKKLDHYKPAPTSARRSPTRRSWLASEGVGRICAKSRGLFAGKPAPTRARRSPTRRSWLASEGVGRICAKSRGPFAGKPAPTSARHSPTRRSWLASEGVGRICEKSKGLFAGEPVYRLRGRLEALMNSCFSSAKLCTAGNCGNSRITLSGAWNRMPASASPSIVVSL